VGAARRGLGRAAPGDSRVLSGGAPDPLRSEDLSDYLVPINGDAGNCSERCLSFEPQKGRAVVGVGMVVRVALQ
jgi:hypothetical protein